VNHRRDSKPEQKAKREFWWRRLRPEERRALGTLGLLCAGVVLFSLSIELGSWLHQVLAS